MKKLKVIISLFLVSVVTFMAFYPSLKNDFVNWDDDEYVTENPFIRHLSWMNLRRIFSSCFSAQYQPLIILSFLLEYQFFGLNPFAYHMTNLILHLLNCLLVFWIIFLITQRKAGISFLTALLFGIHPLHVESVAWVSERKDVLCAFFFLSAIISYCYYWRGRKLKYYYLALVAFLFSLLSKAMAVTLPVVLFLCDWFMQRRRSPAMLTEKIPFFILSVIFGVIFIFTQYTGGAIRSEPAGDIFHKLTVASYCITFYLGKILLPVRLSCEYPLGRSSLGVYLLIQVMLLLIIAAISLKRTRKILFGSAFFLITILPVLQFILVGTQVVADRFVYIPSIGLFYVAASGFAWLYARRTRYPRLKQVILAVLLTAITWTLASLTWKRTQVWQDGMTLWSDVLRKYPRVSVAYNNRGNIYRERGDLDRAISDYSKAIQINPGYAEAYNNRGVAYFHHGNSNQATQDYNKALQINPNYVQAYYNRGNVYRERGDLDRAISDYSKAIQINPNFIKAYNNRGVAYQDQGRLNQAISDYSKAIQINPEFLETYFNRGVAYQDQGRLNQAISDYSKAIQINPDYAQAYYNRAIAYFLKKEYALTWEDIFRAKALRYQISPAFLEDLKKVSERKH